MNATRKDQPRLRALGAVVLATLWLASAGAAAQVLKLEKLTDEQLGRLRKVAIDKGTSVPLPPLLVGVLRLTPAQVAPAVRQVSFQGDDGTKHSFAHLNDESGYFFFRRAPAGMWAFRADKDLKLVASARNFSAEQFMALPAKEGEEELAAEMLAWSKVLSPRGVSLPKPDPRLAPSGNAPLPALPSPPAPSVPGTVTPAPAAPPPASK